jgi:hypothetical protein
MIIFLMREYAKMLVKVYNRLIYLGMQNDQITIFDINVFHSMCVCRKDLRALQGKIGQEKIKQLLLNF